MAETRILITGGRGFVGPVLLEALRKSSFQNSTLMGWQFPGEKTSPAADILNIDIRSRQAVFNAIKIMRPTHIVHTAALSHVPTSIMKPELTWETNVMGTLYLLEAIKEHVPDAGIIYISSSEVYGRSFQQGAAVTEETLLQPQNPYATSKAAADLMAGQYAAQGMQIVRLRPFNHIGSGQSEDFVASAFAAQIARVEAGLQTPEIRVGNLQVSRDFLDLHDVVQAYILTLERLFELPAGLVLNICSGIPRKIEDLLSSLLCRSSQAIQILPDPQRMRPSDTPCAIGCAQAAKLYLGWEANCPFEDTLEKLLNGWRHKIAIRNTTL